VNPVSLALYLATSNWYAASSRPQLPSSAVTTWRCMAAFGDYRTSNKSQIGRHILGTQR